VQTVNELMTQQLAEAGAKIDAIYYCPHTSAEKCSCRKPNTGMLDRAALEHAVDLQRSFVVGDRYGDVELARNVRARSVLVRTGYGEGELAWHAARWPIQPDFVAEDLSQAADLILRERK
jgi:histidinol phosphatase-like enzyme